MKKIFILTLLSIIGCKSEPICTINENNAGKQIYDLDEASCFITLELDKKASDQKLIHSALIAEINYGDKIGLNSGNPNSENEPESSITLDINKLIEYALMVENVDLSEDELLEIYDAEIEYLKFIGVVDE